VRKAGKKHLLTAAMTIGLLSWAQGSAACTGGTRPLSKMDVALAGVIFEGTIREVKDYQLVFDVAHVVRGDLPETRITVTFPRGVGFGPPKSVEGFIRDYGDYTRVALTTPQQSELFCEAEQVCGVRLSGVFFPPRDDLPYVLRNICGSPYFFDVEQYEKSLNYEDNLARFKQSVADLEGREFRVSQHVSQRDLYERIVGNAGGLPWRSDRQTENLAANLYLQYPDVLNIDFASENALDEIETLIGDGPKYWAARTAKQKRRYVRSIAHNLKRIKLILEKDPEFALRLRENG
jgi:hypothetical protein